ncbi:glycosyltransferase family 2 protein [Pseudoponticoccus marisrubri]|uniref:Glucosyl transferase n=1 Tax=Pseudoponticoccus marisrubri TaxID=1685382 RepID=A0A0W7WPU2_9RHOB|nr:glycosyltransferase family A protein [Pseudoponticoccus marisrubri]KUF12605.1 glucosyl transferase [Pseudoponticoccus marisrubri]
MPFASIVVPAFNAAATLPATLASLSAQSYRDLEIVVVDDGSTDATPRIAAEHATRDPRVRLVQQYNRGLAGARNSGIAAATGAVVGFCDADDLWAPDKLDTHVAHLAAAPLVGISYSGSALIDMEGRRLGHAQSPRLTDVTAAHVFKRNPVGNGSAPVIRRAALKAIAWRPAVERRRDWVFDETFRQSEDIECWLRLSLTTDWGIEGVPGLLTEYRVNTSGLSARTDAQLASWERMVTKLRPTDPGFFARHEPAARAYQLRYLARRAVSAGDAATAQAYIRQALSLSRAPLTEEPLRTVTTLAAAELSARLGAAPMRLALSLKSALRG